MAEYFQQKEQRIEALIENLFAAKICLEYDKSNKHWIGDSLEGCLGIPAAILLCSLIDTIGSEFRGSKYQISIDGQSYTIQTASDHFFILNHDKLFNLNLSRSAIMDFYTSYRSKLTHNSALPANNYLGIGCLTDDIFIFNQNFEIVKINLLPLYQKTKDMIEIFIYYLDTGTFSSTHKLTCELEAQIKPYDPGIPIMGGDTGYTYTKK